MASESTAVDQTEAGSARNEQGASVDYTLNLRCGELVEVRSKSEILATLDENGMLDGLVFMPEMVQFCGRQLRVYRTAHKTCDTITGTHMGRRIDDCVHLEDARCDGSAHGGCQAECLFFWKEAWLKRVEPAHNSLMWRLVARPSGPSADKGAKGASCTDETLHRLTVEETASDSDATVYRCQSTHLLPATAPLAWWKPAQYLRDWLSGNVPLHELLRGALFRSLYHLSFFGRGHRLKVRLYNGLARVLGETPYPYEGGRLTGKTPSKRLDLQPGELVRVRPLEEILQTLNDRHNRGMGFAPEMVPYCGNTFRVRSRVKKIIDEKTGKMMHFKNECIILEDVVCRSQYAADRMFCPRSIYAYWREIWLERVE